MGLTWTFGLMSLYGLTETPRVSISAELFQQNIHIRRSVISGTSSFSCSVGPVARWMTIDSLTSAECCFNLTNRYIAGSYFSRIRRDLTNIPHDR